MATPRVTLEATLSGRRFRIVRSPAWERPKLRGDGLTTQPAVVTSPSCVEGGWQPLSSRIDETGDLVTTPGRDEPGPVHPGRDAPAGPVPGVPAGQVRGTPPAAPAAVPHRTLRAGRAVAPRAPPAPLARARHGPPAGRRPGQPGQRGRWTSTSPSPGTCTTSLPASTTVPCWRGAPRCARTCGRRVPRRRPEPSPPRSRSRRHATCSSALAPRSSAEPATTAPGVELDALLADADAHAAARRRLDAAERALPVVPLQRMAISAAARADTAGTAARTALATLRDALPDDLDLSSAAAMADLAERARPCCGSRAGPPAPRPGAGARRSRPRRPDPSTAGSRRRPGRHP